MHRVQQQQQLTTSSSFCPRCRAGPSRGPGSDMVVLNHQSSPPSTASHSLTSCAAQTHTQLFITCTSWKVSSSFLCKWISLENRIQETCISISNMHKINWFVFNKNIAFEQRTLPLQLHVTLCTLTVIFYSIELIVDSVLCLRASGYCALIP